MPLVRLSKLAGASVRLWLLAGRPAHCKAAQQSTNSRVTMTLNSFINPPGINRVTPLVFAGTVRYVGIGLVVSTFAGLFQCAAQRVIETFGIARFFARRCEIIGGQIFAARRLFADACAAIGFGWFESAADLFAFAGG